MSVRRLPILLLMTHFSFAWTLSASGEPVARASSLRRLPLLFEANEGQAERGVDFITRRPGYTAFFEGKRLWLAVQPVSSEPVSSIRMEFVGAQDSRVLGVEESPSGVHYLKGNDPRQWQQNVSTFRRIRYHDLYPGIDVFFYGNPHELEYDFVLAAGADLSQVRLHIAGAERLRVDAEGNLVLRSATPSIRMRKPVAYQELDGERREIACGYVLHGETEVGLELGLYDQQLGVTVDPILEVSTYFGGSHNETIHAVAVDGDGSVYLAGQTQSSDLPTELFAAQPVNAGGVDAFVVKLKADGSVEYATYLGGDGDDVVLGMAVDESGRAHLTGVTRSEDFPTRQAFQAERSGASDAFAAVLSASGRDLNYSTYLGGAREETAHALVLGPSGTFYICGDTNSSNFPTVESLQGEQAGGMDAFVAQFDGTSGELLFSTYFGGTREDVATAATSDGHGNFYLVGYTTSQDFPTREGFANAPFRGRDAFLARIGADRTLAFASYLGGRRSDTATGVAIDGSGIYVVGETDSTDFPLSEPLQSVLAGETDMFISKLDPDGSRLIFSTYLGGTGSEAALATDLDAWGNLYVLGLTDSDDFPEVGTAFTRAASVDTVLVKLDSAGAAIRYSGLIGGGNVDQGLAIAIGSAGEVYAAGSVLSSDFPVRNAQQPNLKGKGIYRSAEGGTAWAGTGSGLSDPNILALAPGPKDSSILYAGSLTQGVFKSVDGGNSWLPAGLAGERITALAVHPTDANVVYAATPFFIHKTSDGGEGWTRAEPGLPLPVAATVIAIDPGNPSVVYVGTETRGVFKTTDGGGVWRAINNGLDGAAQRIFSMLIDPQNSTTLYLGTDGRVFKSTSGGETLWQGTSLNGVGPVRGLAMEASSTTLYASGLLNLGGNDTVSFVATTTDGGETWEIPALMNSLPGVVSSLLVDPMSESTIYAATFSAGILKSSDGGSTWQVSNTGLESLEVRTMATQMNGSAHTVYAATLSGADGFLVKLSPETDFYFPQVGDGQEGRLRFQTTLVFMNAGEDTSATVEFFDSSGAPLALTLSGLGTASSFDIPLKGGQVLSVQTPGTGSIKVGYARVRTGGRVDGNVVFTRSDSLTGRILYEAGVPASRALSRFVLFLDSLGDHDTGIALVNAAVPGSSLDPEAELSVRLFDKDVNLIGEEVIQLAPGEHLARFIRELFADVAQQVAEMRGIVTVESTRPVVAVTVRQRDNPALEFPEEVATLTTFPVIASNSLHNVVYLPQVADGIFTPESTTSFRTAFYLTNTGATTAVVNLDFFDSEGLPMALDLGPLGNRESFRIGVAPGQLVLAETSGAEGFRVGYARVSSNGLGIGTTAVFSERERESDILLYEAGVPASTRHRVFSIFLDSLGVRDTGLAIVNDNEEEAVVSLQVYDKDFQPVAQRTLTLAPGEHLPRMIFELFPGQEASLREMQGLLTVESTQPLVALTLRVNSDPSLQFPATVPALTTFPVVPGAPVPEETLDRSLAKKPAEKPPHRPEEGRRTAWKDPEWHGEL